MLEEEIIEESVIDEEVELTEGIDTPLEHAIQSLGQARLSSERKAILDQLDSKFRLTLKISKIERTLLGDPGYRGGTSLHGLIDGGPFSGLIQLHTDIEDHGLKVGETVVLDANLEDYRSSLKRAVLKSERIQG